jgi:hypothetical protein
MQSLDSIQAQCSFLMSGAQFQLVKVINEYRQVREDAVADLLNLIQAPSTLKSFLYQIPLLPEVLEAASKIAEVSDMDAGRYRIALATANLLASVVSELEGDVRLRDFRVPAPIPRFGPYEGVLGTHPLYSVLAEIIPDKNYHSRFVHLKAQLLLAMESLGTVDEELLDVLQTPFRRFRALTEQNNWKFLKGLPAIPVPVTRFAEIVKTIFRKTGFQSVSKIFEVAEDSLSRKKRAKKKPSVRKTKLPKPIREDDEDAAAEYLKDILPSTTLSLGACRT